MVNVTYDACAYQQFCLFQLAFKYSQLVSAGDVIWFDPDAQAEVVYNNGDLAWIIAATALVWIMIPGVGYFYSGLLRRKNALSMIFLGVAVLAVVSFQWFFWGYSLAFSETADKYIGDLSACLIYFFF